MRPRALLGRLHGFAQQCLADTGHLPSTSAATASTSPSAWPWLASSHLHAHSSNAARCRGSLQLQRSLHASARSLAEETGARAAAGDPAPVSMRTLILALMAGAGVLYGVREYKDQKLQQIMVQSQKVAGQASVGGPFELIDQDGKPFTDRDLLGEFALLYFGFTHCPDICPDEMEKVSAAVDLIDKWTGVKVTPVFISVDPDRDKPHLVKEYVREFHPRMLGLTGEMHNIKKISKSYRVYYNKTGDSDTDYLVDHSIIHYLINPDGEFVTFFSKSTTTEQLATQVIEQLATWQQQHLTYHPEKVLKAPTPAAAVAPAKVA